ncbi:carboxymuconolactone decarboxylase family protein [Alkalihalobacillus sp. CinArs1]|uniref:carboxymuconolactone decarboxylase family protein n=1 Tax=Alkalihalobacillus sp. CinArs1 TaxID=2995314 RepID=UPI0022DE3CD5|nr:peroxidase-related enzyme [Alkalihalobacillus sp. CinArs1]
MPWIKPAKQSELKEMAIYEELEKPVPVFNRLIAKSPEIFSTFMPLAKAIKNGVLNDFETEAVVVYVSKLNGCHYCFEGHSKLLKQISKNDNIVEELTSYRTSDAIPEHVKDILNYAEKLVSSPSELQKEDLDKLREHGYSEQNIVEINQLIAYTSYTNQTSIGLGL